MIGFSTSPRFVEHDTGPHHPERPDRIRAIFAAVREAGMIGAPNPFNDLSMRFGIAPSGFSIRELEPSLADPKWLTLVHTPQHMDRIRHVCEIGGGVLDLGDTPVGPSSYEIALLSLGSCDALRRCGDRRRGNACLLRRPPAGASCRARSRHGILPLQQLADRRDATHRNITASARSPSSISTCITATARRRRLESDPNVLFISLHQHPRTCYPGTGYEWEIGTGAGAGLRSTSRSIRALTMTITWP